MTHSVIASTEQTVTLAPSKDNTLIQTNDGSLSLGDADHFYAGRVGPMGGGTLRRGVIAFDVASALPPDAIVTEATLSLFVSGAQTGGHTLVLKRLLADWGEGTSEGFGGVGAPSTPNDATWLHRFWPDVFWSSPGGDFTSVISASAVIDHAWEWYTWGSTPQLVSDVQDMVDNPGNNFGWLVQGNETNLQSVQQFTGKKAPPQFRPHLDITYRLPVSCPADLTGSGGGDPDGVVNVFDLLSLLAQWGPCPVPPDECPADLTGSGGGDSDGVVNVFDLLSLLAQWGPCP